MPRLYGDKYGSSTSAPVARKTPRAKTSFGQLQGGLKRARAKGTKVPKGVGAALRKRLPR